MYIDKVAAVNRSVFDDRSDRRRSTSYFTLCTLQYFRLILATVHISHNFFKNFWCSKNQIQIPIPARTVLATRSRALLDSSFGADFQALPWKIPLCQKQIMHGLLSLRSLNFSCRDKKYGPPHVGTRANIENPPFIFPYRPRGGNASGCEFASVRE